jgi:peptide deformylase
MSVREIVQIGDPVLRERAHELTQDELASPETQQLIDDIVATMRSAGGAGLAAPQLGVPLRIFAVEVRDNPRYPYKPSIPLRVVVNPVVRALDGRTFRSYEGCLSIPNLRGLVDRHSDIEIAYRDRDGGEIVERVRGLSAGTFQHELDHLDGILFVDRVGDPRTLTTWAEFHRRHERPWLESVRAEIEGASIEPRGR